MFVRDVVERLCAAGALPLPDQLIGVPSVELDLWERRLQLKLPTDYRAFMEIAGATKGAQLFSGENFFWPGCLGLRELARDCLDPDEYAAIPSDALFVFEHQGYIFGWLDTREDRAPAYVSEPADVDERRTRRIADSFRTLLMLDQGPARGAASAVVEGESSVFPPTPRRPFRTMWRWAVARLRSRRR